MNLFCRAPAFLLFAFLISVSCRKEYNPPAVQGNNHFLAVDGFINTAPNTITNFNITRSLNLSDSVQDIYEPNARVTIRSTNGDEHFLTDTSGRGTYISTPLTLDTSQSYQLEINTSDGEQYLSDFVKPKVTPPIDSITWTVFDDPSAGHQTLNINVNAHDVSNSTQYYRWDYIQTYKHRAFYSTPWARVGDSIVVIGQDAQYNCWNTVHSSNVLLGTTISLSQDVISQITIARFDEDDPMLDVGSSFLVHQYALTPEAYTYWLTIQKNSQSLGGLFDLQPSQISGNIHCTTNPNLPAFGFLTATTVSELRAYVSNTSLPGWKSNPGYSCDTKEVTPDQLNLRNWIYTDEDDMGPYHFSGSFPPIMLILAPLECLDCRYQGGTIVRPTFWPQYD